MKSMVCVKDDEEPDFISNHYILRASSSRDLSHLKDFIFKKVFISGKNECHILVIDDLDAILGHDSDDSSMEDRSSCCCRRR